MESDNSATVRSDAVNGGTGIAPAAVTEIEEVMDSFRLFDVVSGKETDHFFFNRQSGVKSSAGSSASASASASAAAATSPVQKKIMKEWKILQKSLPSSIYVRVYESRIDLMRAAILGAAGTPYHDGLFFFDICFPADYPASPPLVHYRSFGVRINPNLYASGRVCLSLLNTWAGKKTERWNPRESTILQVLLSIQALVLNEKPFFNEPGLGGIPGRMLWEKKSAAYSEDVFILSCKTMLWLLRQPPIGFEAFTAAHFHDHARPILAACQVYALGVAKVGCYSLAAARPSRSSATSERFKASMKELYPALVSAFRGLGASVADFGDQLPGKAALPVNSTETGEESTAKKKKKIRTFADKIFVKLGKLLGLQKRMKKKKNKGEVYSSTQVIPKPPELFMALV